jgi:hypothetical protein
LQTKAGSLSINATGNPIGMVVQGAVGIGTTSPGARLHVENGGDYLRYTGTDLLLSGAGSGRGTGGRALVADGSETLTINYAGDFGGGVNVGSVLRVPELCLNGDCRKVWPSGGTTTSGITGSGTTGKLPKWTGSTSIGDSIVSDSGSLITIGGGLNVNGQAQVDYLQVDAQNSTNEGGEIMLARSSSSYNNIYFDNYNGDARLFGTNGANVNLIVATAKVGTLCLSGDCRSAWPSGGTGSGITGSGTTGKLPKWTGSTALGDSIVTEGSGVVSIAGGLGVNGALNVSIGASHFNYTGTDLLLSGAGAGRGDGGRALVADGGEALTINYGGDFSGGVNVHSKLSVSGQLFSNTEVYTTGRLAAEGDIRSNNLITARTNVCIDSGKCLGGMNGAISVSGEYTCATTGGGDNVYNNTCSIGAHKICFLTGSQIACSLTNNSGSWQIKATVALGATPSYCNVRCLDW